MKESDLFKFGGLTAVVVGFIVFVLLGIVVSRILQRWLHHIIARNGKGSRLYGSIIANLLRFVVWGGVVSIICDQCFGVDAAGIIGALGVVGIAVSLGAQQTIANIIGGLIITLTKTIDAGDWVTISGHKESQVVDTDWRNTTLRDEDGIVYVVPNSVMTSSIVAKGNPFYTIVIPFALRLDVHNVEGLLLDCEQALLDRQVEQGEDWEQTRPKASVVGTTVDGISCEVKIYVNRTHDTRYVLRAVAPALVELLQERGALARTVERGQ